MRRRSRDRQDLRLPDRLHFTEKVCPHGPAGSQPVVVSTSSVALQDAIIGEYIPFCPGFFWRTVLFKAHPGDGAKRQVNALSATSVLQGGWKP